MSIKIDAIETKSKPAQGLSVSWKDGQFVTIVTENGMVACGAFDVKVMDEFNAAMAIAKGTPQKPLKVPDDLLGAKIVGVTSRAAGMGIKVGMSGREALELMSK